MTLKQDWIACDGEGGVPRARSRQQCNSAKGEAEIAISRRHLLVGAALGSLLWASKRSALSQMAISKPGSKSNILVNIFLRGGMDGLNAVVPYGEDEYHKARPSLGVGAPRDQARASNDRALDLDGFFGLNPALAPLLPLYQSGYLAPVHAVGSGDETRSHFEAMATMEHGMSDQSAGAASGWLARHLQSTAGDQDSPLRAVAFSTVMPDSLRGATQATALESLSDFRLAVGGGEEASFRSALTELYGSGKDTISQAGRETLSVLDSLNRVDPKNYKPSNGARYPDSDLGRGLQQVAFLIKADLGLEVAFLDKGGWDTHVAQAQLLSGHLDDLSRSLAAFAKDLGGDLARVTTVVQTEFGRRVQENTGLGTDHGHGSVMFLMGGGVQGGKVHGTWPGLKEDALDGPGDLQVTTDYRSVLAEVLRNRCGNAQTSDVFPNLEPEFLGFVRA